MFIDTQTLSYPLTEASIRAAHPSTLFGVPFRSDRYKPVAIVPAPVVNTLTHEVRELAPQQTNGEWHQVWSTVALPQKAVDERTAAAIEELKATLVFNTQKRLDVFAATRGYSGTDSLSKYQNLTDAQIASLPTEDLRSQVSKFRTECQYLALMTAATWATLYSIMNEVLTGDRAMPSGYADVEPDLPTLEWPSV
jgi:hypothetical protein